MIKNHSIQKQGNRYEITLFLDQATEEFASELGSKHDKSTDQLNKSVQKYIKEKFPNVKQATVKIMAGTMLVSTLAFGAGGVLKSAEAAEVHFSDVQDDAYFAEPIKDLVERGIISGYDDDTFKPGDDITRAEFSKMLAIALDLDTTDIGAPDFPDVAADNWAAPYISVLSEQGIINGYPDDTFRPNQTITRAEMAKMLVTAYDTLAVEETVGMPFTDVTTGSWSTPFIAGLYKNEITTGVSPTAFAPKDEVTRGQAATFLYRTIHLGVEAVAEVASVATINNPFITTGDPTVNAFDVLLFLDEDGNRVEEVDRTLYTIADSAGYFNPDGSLSEDFSEKGITTEGTISIQVSKDGTKVNEFDVKVVNGDKFNTILDAQIKNAANENVAYATLGSTYMFDISTALKYNGEVITDEDTPLALAGFAGADLSSSDDSVIVVRDNGEITPVSTGTADIIVKWNDKTFTYPVEVKETPEAASLNILAGNTLVLTSGENQRDFAYSVKDQHGADFTNQTITFEAVDEENAVDGISLSISDGKIVATADSEKVTKDVTAKYNVIQDGETLGEITVSYLVASDVTSYDLRADTDTTIDAFLNGTNVNMEGETVATDRSVAFTFLGLDDDGLVSNIFNTGDAATNKIENYQVSLAGVDEENPEAQLAVGADGTITVTATENAPREGKDITVLVKEGNIERASATVTVKNTTPDPAALTTFVLADGKERITLTADTTFSNLVTAGTFVAEDQYGKTFNLTTASDLRIYSGDEDVFTIGEGNAITITGEDGDSANLVITASGVTKVFTVLIDTTPNE